MVRTRVAPSPTGYPHIGTIYQSLFDFAFAKRHHGKFFVRIEDTDRVRFVPDAEEKIYAALDWFGLTEDESVRKGGQFGPYRQSQRLTLYKKYARELIEKDGAYYCFCSKERLEEIRKKQQEQKKPIFMYDKHCRTFSREEVKKKLAEGLLYVIRLKVPEHTDIVVHDVIRGDIHFNSDLIEDTVLVKADGYPTYHLASSVVDDHLMQTSHIVRGEEWLSSLPKHIILYNYFGWEKPLFVHTPVLRNPDKSKLSKRQGHTNISWYQEEGFLPEAILNYLALMAWSHPEEKEIFSLQEFISLVDFKDMKPVGPIFDIKKLEWMNGEYIRMISIEALTEKLIAYDADHAKNFDKNTLKKLILLAQTRMNTLKEFTSLTAHFVSEPEIAFSDQEKTVVHNLKKSFETVSDWKADYIFPAMKKILTEYKIKMSVLYTLLTGQNKGLPLPESLEILGKEKTLKRLKI